MSEQDLIYEVADGIATVTLNRPEVMNALSPGVVSALHAAFDTADADRAVRVIILTGAGAAFCSGYDQGPRDDGKKRGDPTGKSIAEFI